MAPLYFLSLLCTLLLSVSVAATCDEYAYPAEYTKASKLTPNTFHKICPSKSSLGATTCGDGTPFSFYYSSPVQRRSTNKVLIEFSGGGACWDAMSCEYNTQMLTFPYQLDEFLGLSCSEIAAGVAQGGGDNGDYQDVPVNMLCAQKVGETDFREYHTIIVPYCTQDNHVGSNTITYDDGQTVHHRGGSNMLSVLEWVYKNFPHPEQVVLTGCSAGAGVLPIAYDLVYHHYNTFLKGKSISTLLDSPVWLTPTYFLEEGLPNWNAQPLLKKLRFNYNKYSQSEDFIMEIAEHVLKRGSKKSPFGVITHTSDPISLAYFQAMNGAYANDDDDGRRRLEDNQDGDEEEWWSELSSDLNRVSAHSNVDTYIIDGDGHCSFGLYYALMEGGEDFEEWAGNLLIAPSAPRPTGRGWFWFSALVGVSLVGATVWHQRQVETQQYDTKTNPHEMVYSQQTLLKGSTVAVLHRATAFVASYSKDSPVTIAYGVAVTIYFLRIITWDGFEMFFYNPSLGPSAVTLSAFGINNPTLVVYQHQILRVVTSTFLCSGIVTYGMVMCCLYYQVRHIEKIMRSMAEPSVGRFRFASLYFLQVATLIAIGSNLIYAMIVSGASCSSMALALGLQAFSCTMHEYYQQVEFPRSKVLTISLFVFTSLFLPYNNWVMMGTAMLIGVGLAIWVYWVYIPCFVTPADAAAAEGNTTMTTSADYTSYSEDNTKTFSEDAAKPSLPAASTRDPHALTLLRRNRPLQALIAFFVVLLICLMAQLRRPNQMYEQPFLTGCSLVYTSHVDEIAGSYVGDQFAGNSGDNSQDSNDGGRRRRRRLENESGNSGEGEEEERDEEHMCAQFCVPHLVSRPFMWGAGIFTGFDVTRGLCEEDGYSQHIADKTFSYKSYSVDVELFFNDNYSYGDDGGDGDE